MEPNSFCHKYPTDWEDCHEVKLHISESNKVRFSALPKGLAHFDKSIVAFDSISRTYFAIRRFPCFADSEDCYCAAQAQRLSSSKDKVKWEPITFPEPDEEEED